MRRYFVKERAALELVEAITSISEGQVPDTIHEQAESNLSKAAGFRLGRNEGKFIARLPPKQYPTGGRCILNPTESS